jgi:hypothetical protein
MKLFLRRNAPLFYALGAMLALYIPWLNRGYNNYEYPFVFAGRALANSADADLINAYWPYIANPLGYSIVLSAIYKVFSFQDQFWVSRLPAISGAALVITSGWIMKKTTSSSGNTSFYIWSSLVLLHPMLIAFSTSGTTDMLPVGLLMISIALIRSDKGSSFVRVIYHAMIFGLAVIVKYNTAYFGLALLSLAIYRPNEPNLGKLKRIIDSLIYLLVPIFMLGCYLLWSQRVFGIFISSRLEISQPRFFEYDELLATFAKYLAFFGLFCGFLPLSQLFPLQTKISKSWCSRTVGVVVVTLLFGWLSAKRSIGELNFGRLFEGDFEFLFDVAESFGLLLGVLAVVEIARKFKSRTNVALTFGIFPYLVLISASYPSQRYLNFVLPGALYILVESTQLLVSKLRILLFASTAVLFATFAIIGMAYLTSQGNASEEMAVWVEENDLISQTSAGPILPHAGQHWWGVTPDETRYEIIAVTPSAEAQVKERILHREPMKVLGKVTRVYLLREIPAAP